eukprot:Phypoly_transcript_03283.p1 GENE.Phypoly_transcript_03283~~Phypoly_transcript_03283.p1  ORF type:complete len:763 (+),score=203.00 Phypoly_transcript_03283:172-2460(+)
MSSEEDAELEELRRKREERRRLQQEEERKEEEERARKEEERKQRRLERERKAKEREEVHAKELEEVKKRNDKEDERKKKREERERQRQEEERLEKEAEEKRAKEREEKKRKEQEEAEEEERNKKKKEMEDLRKSQEELPSRDRREESRPDARRRSKNEKLMDIIKSGKPDSMDKIVIDDDMKEEATKLLTEENELVVDFFNKSETIMTILKYISTVQAEPEKLNDDQLEDIMGRMEFAKEAITGGIPSLWRTLLQPENRPYLAELFALLLNDNPILPPINVSCFWKSIEFLLARRSYEITNFMMTSKDVIPSFFKHLRDTNLMDIFIKLVEKETVASPLFKEYDPKKAAELSADDTRFWTDAIPDNMLERIGKGGAGEDTEWSDVEIESIAQFSILVLDKFATSKLAYQLRDSAFCSELIARVFDPFAEASNGTAANGVSHGKAKYRHQSTVVALLSYITQLLKFSTNTSAYSTDTIPPLVACLIYGSGGKRSQSSVIPVNIINNWVNNKIPDFEFPIEHLGKKNPNKIGVMRVKCVQLLRALFVTNFQCVDITLRDNGALQTCVDLFFHNVDNNIVHSLIEEIIKLFLTREANSPLTELDSSTHPVTTFTQFLLDDCNLVERLVATLRTIALNKNQFTHFSTAKLDLDEPAHPEKENGKMTLPRSAKRRDEKLPDKDRREKPFLPPAFVGHVLDICKAITVASEKSVKIRHLVASCSGYHWGQTVMFHLGMRDSADMEWKKPFKKPVPLDNPPASGAVKGD